MAKKWLHWLNLALLSCLLFIVVAALAMVWLRPTPATPKPPAASSQQLPPHAFQMTSEAYKTLNYEFFHLNREPPTIQLPNLRTVLNYYGKNGRPDADAEKPLLHFGLASGREVFSIKTGEPMYLVYERSSTPPKYIFAPWNLPTPLWVVGSPSGSQVLLHVFLKSSDGSLVQKPQANASFTLPEKDIARFAGISSWEIDKLRVDGTLLVRQKARWYGPDLFLARYGGAPYAELANKQRIDFGEGEEIYPVYLDEHSCLIWKDNRWQVVTPGPDTVDYPLMCVKKIDTRLINFEVWDATGRHKIALNLLKTNDTAAPKTLVQNIKFLGARTLSRFLFEVNGERIILTPHEWLIFKDNRWYPIRTPQEIQAYVDRKLIAPLFIFDGVVRKDDRQLLTGTLFNTSRTEATPVELPLLSGATTTKQILKNNRKGDEKKTLAIPPTQTNNTGNSAGGENAAKAALTIPGKPPLQPPGDDVDDDDEESEE